MTPTELLEDVKKRPMVFLIDEAEQLEKYLRQALGKFEDKAGVILEMWQDEPDFILPLPHFLSTLSACDAKRRHIPWRQVVEVDEDGEQVKIIRLSPPSRAESPYCLYYFANLREWPADEDLPHECTSLLADYMEAIMAIQNSERILNLYLVTGMHDSVQNIPSQQELRQRVVEIETAMEESKAIVPPASWF